MQRSFSPDDISNSPQQLSEGWENLCDQFLPLKTENTIWRHSRYQTDTAPCQGWKIHISATVLTANRVLSQIGPFLRSKKIYFKAPLSLEIVMQLNSGIFFSYTQVGKIFTIYPESESQFISLVPKLALLLCDLKSAPLVPYDYRYSDSCIYYRYGAFRRRPDSTAAIEEPPYIIGPTGTEIPDERCVLIRPQSWLKDPFAEAKSDIRFWSSNYLVHKSISQRGKGGVYRCLDQRHSPPMPCILKEGRENGELLWDGRDGTDRIKNEGDILDFLAANGTLAPKVLDRFSSAGNRYLVLEEITGINLRDLADRSESEISGLDKQKLSYQMCRILADLHGAGIIWRDCKLNNFLVDLDENVRPIDFEGACKENESEDYPWCTPLYTAPEISVGSRSKIVFNRSHDLFALGVCLFYLWNGFFPTSPRSSKSEPPFSKTPIEVRHLIQKLLEADATKRPSANTAAFAFDQMIKSLARNNLN